MSGGGVPTRVSDHFFAALILLRQFSWYFALPCLLVALFAYRVAWMDRKHIRTSSTEDTMRGAAYMLCSL